MTRKYFCTEVNYWNTTGRIKELEAKTLEEAKEEALHRQVFGLSYMKVGVGFEADNIKWITVSTHFNTWHEF